MNNKLLGLRIKEARLAREYNQETLASAVGLDKSTISRYERGEIDSPKLPVIEALAIALHTNPAWLIGESQDKTYTPPNSNFELLEPCNLFSTLRPIRKAFGISPEDAAYKIGISKSDYLAIENGRNTDCLTLARIAEFYCCSTDYILAFDGVFGEESKLGFVRGPLMRLHHYFSQLPPEDQEKVICLAQTLAAQQ